MRRLPMNMEFVSEIVGRAEEKIDDLQAAITVFVRDNAETIRSYPNLDVSKEGTLNTLIDDIVSEIWNALSLVIPHLPEVADGGTSGPAIWSGDFRAPSITYGPEQKTALAIIDALDPHARENHALAEALRNLIRITGHANRSLRVCRPNNVYIVGYRQSIPQPNPEAFTVGLVPHENDKVELALVKSSDMIFDDANPVVDHLRNILEAVESLTGVL